MILTGARLREILELKWEYVDFERGLLLLPDSKTGAKSIILNAPAFAVLAGLNRVGAYVIAGQSAGTDGERPRADLIDHGVDRPTGRSRWRANSRPPAYPCEFWRRRRPGSADHRQAAGARARGTTQRYAHLDTDPLRRASDHIAARIAAALGEPDPNS